MARVKEVPTDPSAPEDFLWLALRADTAKGRARYAREGLGCTDEQLAPDTQVLLLRQLYMAQLELRQLRRAADVARQMAAIGPLKDIAHHDAARALFALGDIDEAIAEQRLAARAAPAARRSFHLWSLATWQHFAGDVDGALGSLRRAERWASRDAALVRAQAAYVRLDAGEAPEALGRIVRDLEKSRAREGYGQYLLGMIAYLMGDHRKAAAHLRAFLRRNASVEEAKALTLREELRRSRLVLAEVESD